MFKVTVLPEGRRLEARGGEKLLDLLRGSVAAPCGGQGKCGKCRVTLDGREVLACAVTVDRDMTVTLPETFDQKILTDSPELPGRIISPAEGYTLALDIGTTTLVCSLLDGSGRELAVAACPNPQAGYGADVVTRIREALDGRMEELTRLVRSALEELGLRCCREAGIKPRQVNIVSPVGNTCMRQLFLGLSPENLAKLILLVENKAINSTVAKEVFEVVFDKDIDPEAYVEEKGLKTVNDQGALRKTIEYIVETNQQSVEDYHNGKQKAIGFLVGQTMKAMQGKADPAMVNQILKEILES